jgi:hypothetical protein
VKRSHRAVRRCLAVSAFVVAAGPCVAFAETPGEIPKPWTYEGSMKLQEQERQRDQQYQQQAQPQGGARTVPGGNAGGAAAAASAAAAAPTHELDRVEYRGDAKHVVVLPKATVKLMEFDVEGSNRIDWKSQNCVLVKVARRQPRRTLRPGWRAQPRLRRLRRQRTRPARCCFPSVQPRPATRSPVGSCWC